VSLDLIYGVPGQSCEEAAADARRAVDLAPEHLSAYALTLDPEALAEEVVLARRVRGGEVQLPPDDTVVAMAGAVEEVCERGGLARYEISNFARPGHESRHNRLYWTGAEYLALGCGAVGFIRSGPSRGVRYTNLRRAPFWLEALEAGRAPDAEREALGPEALCTEAVMTGLRTVEGVDVRAVFARYERPFGASEEALRKMVAEGLVLEAGGRVALTARGRALHTSVAGKLVYG
jgi:oxygen-independent coproporphyrinogen-3 oxidase